MRQPSSAKQQQLYPWLGEGVSGVGFDAGAVLAFLAFVVIVGFQGFLLWVPISETFGLGGRPRLSQQTPEPTSVVVGAVGIIQTPTPHVVQIEIVTPTPAHVPNSPVEELPRVGEILPGNYSKQLIVGRFSNYWPAYGGTNCFADCELFADGSRVDQAIMEGWRVVACPADWLLGTRFEWPPDSGHVWTCRDRGEDIYSYVAESGLVVYWFDFLSPTAFVDFGSYIQLQVWVPNERVVP